MSSTDQATTKVARDYYNSCDADTFYCSIWGGEDIHIGLYQSDDESICDASRRTVERMAELAGPWDKNTKVLDIGAGYGGAMRFLAKEYGCKAVALNLSEVENERDRKMNKEQGLDHRIDVVDGSFEELPFPDGSFDVVWSQDAILHSGDREKVMREVVRVLKPGGRFVFTDPMRSDNCPPGVLQPILDRIHLNDLGSPSFYRKTGEKLGLTVVTDEDHSEQVANHYGRVLRETKACEAELSKDVSKEYIANMKKGLRHWVDGGKNGYLSWHIFVLRK